MAIVIPAAPNGPIPRNPMQVPAGWWWGGPAYPYPMHRPSLAPGYVADPIDALPEPLRSDARRAYHSCCAKGSGSAAESSCNASVLLDLVRRIRETGRAMNVVEPFASAARILNACALGVLGRAPSMATFPPSHAPTFASGLLIAIRPPGPNAINPPGLMPPGPSFISYRY